MENNDDIYEESRLKTFIRGRLLNYLVYQSHYHYIILFITIISWHYISQYIKETLQKDGCVENYDDVYEERGLKTIFVYHLIYFLTNYIIIYWDYIKYMDRQSSDIFVSQSHDHYIILLFSIYHYIWLQIIINPLFNNYIIYELPKQWHIRLSITLSPCNIVFSLYITINHNKSVYIRINTPSYITKYQNILQYNLLCHYFSHYIT